MIVSVDPGLHDSGVAIWHPRTGELHTALLVSTAHSLTGSKAWITMAGVIKSAAPGVTELVIEIPQIYETRARGKGDPNDLIQLAACAGTIVGRLSVGVEVLEVRPAVWKGQVPKDVTRERCLAALSEKERTSVQLPRAKSLQHNVWDAVGLGFWYLKKLRLRVATNPVNSSSGLAP